LGVGDEGGYPPAKALQNDLANRLSVSVHLSPQQLTSDIVSMVRSALTESQLDAQDLVLEIAESCLMTPKDLVITQLQALRGLGVRIAIYDFGSGYSSRGALRRLPVDILKIDRSFADRITDDPQASDLTKAVINLARTLDLRTIAEGIDTFEQTQALRDLAATPPRATTSARPLRPSSCWPAFAIQGCLPGP
jgi:EAL domain-containing protein (putative c-di-GMP-specific phosphodiesterase class I)